MTQYHIRYIAFPFLYIIWISPLSYNYLTSHLVSFLHIHHQLILKILEEHEHSNNLAILYFSLEEAFLGRMDKKSTRYSVKSEFHINNKYGVFHSLNPSWTGYLLGQCNYSSSYIQNDTSNYSITAFLLFLVLLACLFFQVDSYLSYWVYPFSFICKTRPLQCFCTI